MALIDPYLDLLRETPVERAMREERIHAWHQFTPEEWRQCAARAEEKDAVSERVGWTRRWNPNFNLLGEIGEATYSRVCGKPQKAGFGDGGEDFPGVDVKATSHYQSPRLLRLQSDLLRADFFALVAVDLDAQRGRYVGYATRDELAAAEVREYGYGPTRTLLESALHRGLPT